MANLARATVTVRLVRSFEYRNIKSIVLHNVDLDLSVEEFKVLISSGRGLIVCSNFDTNGDVL